MPPLVAGLHEGGHCEWPFVLSLFWLAPCDASSGRPELRLACLSTGALAICCALAALDPECPYTYIYIYERERGPFRVYLTLYLLYDKYRGLK